MGISYTGMAKDTKQFNPGWFIVLFLSLFPVVLWLLYTPTIPRFSNATVSLSNIGQIFGLVGATMFAINLMLSTRLKFIEKLFFGLNRVYERHSHLGQIAFMLLIFHPLFLLSKYAGNSFHQAALFLLPSSDWPINWGWLALVGMILLIVATLYIPLKYNFWKVTHKFFGLFFFFASLHIWLIPSDVSHYLPLRIYMLGISLLGLCAYFYYSLLGKLFVKKFHYLVKSVRPLGDDIIDIIMEPQGEILHFNPGQFIFVSFDDKNIGKESHPFSISSGSNEKNISITIKKSGDYTNKLNNIPIGTNVNIEGPYGVFSHANIKNKRQIWIAGGIGITPFISMVKTLQLNDGHDIDLYYCLKNKNEAVYLEYLKTIALSLNDRLKIFPHYSSQEGRISAQVIEHQSGGLVGKDIFICAPPPMISSLKSQLLEKGINKKLIHSEEFSF